MGHAVLWFGIAIVLFPLYIALVATSHTYDVLIGSTPLWFGGEFIKNFTTVLTEGLKASGGIPVWVMMANSLVMALGIAIGKIAISITAAYAIVYFRFPGRELCFVLIFITLMMPVEVRIVPTFSGGGEPEFHRQLHGARPAAHRLGHGDLPLPPDVHDHPGGTA